MTLNIEFENFYKLSFDDKIEIIKQLEIKAYTNHDKFNKLFR